MPEAVGFDQNEFWQMQTHSSRNDIAILTVFNFRGRIVRWLEKRRQYRVLAMRNVVRRAANSINDYLSNSARPKNWP
ncbi:MAG: hypothetical protein ACKVHE_03475 [Planctomycetales bacterium]|jgi:hypothetical protein